MFLEKLWPHIPTPLINVIVLIEAALIYFYSDNYLILSLTFISILTMSFILGSIKHSQPFHIERLAVIITLAFINVSILAQHMNDVYMFLHLHSAHDMFIGRVVYAILWLILVAIAVVGYFRNAGQQISRAWPILVMITLIAMFIPIEPESFVMNQPPWLWILRVMLAIIIFTLVTIGDTTNITLVIYYHRLESRRRGHAALTQEPNAHEADLPIARTLIWMPITLWVIFAPKALIIVAVFLIIWLARSVYERWQRVSDAHYHFMHSQTLFQKATHFVGLDRILSALEDIENQTLDMVRQHIQHEQTEVRKSEERRRSLDMDLSLPNNNTSLIEHRQPHRHQKHRKSHQVYDEKTSSTESSDSDDESVKKTKQRRRKEHDNEQMVIDMINLASDNQPKLRGSSTNVGSSTATATTAQGSSTTNASTRRHGHTSASVAQW